MTAFGTFTLDTRRRLLRRDGAILPIEGRAMDILVFLAERIGTVVDRQALIQAVWQGRHVEDNNLSVHISALRRLLGPASDGRAMIQTVPGRGYMLLADGADTGTAMPAAPAVAAHFANSFVGRIKEYDALLALIADNALVTITAGGGIGKTRMARRAAHDLAANHPDGVHIAELATIDDPALAAEHVAALFPLGNASGTATARITNLLRTRRLLLVLDNCEHVLAPIAELATAIIAQCPGVSILATSREALGVQGERLFRLPPHTVPARSAEQPPLTATKALAYDAVRLFVERATTSVPGFVFDDATVPAIVDICTQLDGIALAIEMAAPRLRVLTPPQLAARLHESLRLLAAPDRAVVARHRTLRAMMDWSHSLLDDAGKRLLQCMGVFAGPVDLVAVCAVAIDGEPDELDVLEQLTDLVDKSLVIADTSAGQARYRLLETVRQYTRERLWDTLGSDGRAALRGRHAQYWTGVFEAAAQAWPTTPTETWLPPILAAVEDLRAALAWCFGPDGDSALGLRLVGASVTVWWELPNLPLREARAWFDRAVEFVGPNTPDLVAARVWFGHAWRDMRQGDTANLPAAETAVELFARTDDRAGQGAALWRAGSAANTPDGAERAEAALLAAEAVLRQVPPGKWLSLCLIRLGDLRMRAGDTDAALAAYEEGMDLARQTRHWYGLTNGGSNSADLLFMIGRPDDALAQLVALRAQLPLGPRTPLTSKLGSHLVAAGRVQEALAVLTEVLDQALSIGYVAAFARSLETLALLRAEAGDAVTAALLAGYARNAVPSTDRWGAPRVVLDRLEAAMAQALPHATLARRLRQGAAWDEPTAHAAARAALSLQIAPLN